jgi:hypothetical protein
MRPQAIYLVGVVALGLAYPWLKQNLSGVALVVGAIDSRSLRSNRRRAALLRPRFFRGSYN